MKKTRRPRGTYDTRNMIICAWCGEHHECVKLEKATCSGKCRSKLMRYRQRTGLDPLEPPGNISVEEAIQELFRALCADERVRRVKALARADAEANCILAAMELERKREADRKRTG